MDHPSVEVIKKILKSNKITFGNVSTPYICTYCLMGNSHKLTLKISQTIYSKPHELMAIDLWGFALIDTDYEYKYYISFIDAYSRFIWIYFLK